MQNLEVEQHFSFFLKLIIYLYQALSKTLYF